MENDKNNYSPIDYRINKDLNSIKPKKPTNTHKIFYTLLGVIIFFSLIIILLQYYNNGNLKSEMKHYIITDSIQKISIDSLKHKVYILKYTVDSLKHK